MSDRIYRQTEAMRLEELINDLRQAHSEVSRTAGSAERDNCLLRLERTIASLEGARERANEACAGDGGRYVSVYYWERKEAELEQRLVALEQRLEEHRAAASQSEANAWSIRSHCLELAKGICPGTRNPAEIMRVAGLLERYLRDGAAPAQPDPEKAKPSFKETTEDPGNTVCAQVREDMGL